MAEFLKVLSVFISIIFLAKIGISSAVILFKFNFLKVFIVSVTSGIFGAIVFTHFSSVILNWWDRKFGKKNTRRKKNIFNKRNRRIIIIKRKFGLAGIAFITPVLLSIPIGSFLGQRFYRNKTKVITYISLSVVFWTLVIYSVMLGVKKGLF